MHRVLFASAAFLGACSGPAVPAEVTCTSTVTAVADDATLASALASATAGDCIVLAGGRYTGPIVVATAGLTLTAEDGARVEVASATDGLRITAGAWVHAIHVRSAGRHGVVIVGAGARFDDAQVLAAGEAGVMIKCEDAGCMGLTARISLEDVEVRGAAYGLYVSGADVQVTGGVIADVRGEQLGGGAGVYAVAGASLELLGTRIEDNVYGLIADGAATHVRARDCVVARNADLGVWAQGLRGSAAAPALELSGAATRVVDNGVTGVGGFDSAGLRVEDVEISGTVEKEVLIDLVSRVRIGDGLGLLAQTREVDVVSTRLVDNARAQAIVDGAGADIHFARTNTISGGRHEVVIQNSVAIVDVPLSQISTGVGPLGIQLRAVSVPTLVP